MANNGGPTIRKWLEEMFYAGSWSAIEWGKDNLPGVIKAAVTTIVTYIVGLFANASWFTLTVGAAAIFGLSMLGFNQFDAIRDRRRRSRIRETPSTPLPVSRQNDPQVPKDKEPELPLSVSPQDAANREKIIVLVRVYADPAYDVALLVTQKIFGGLENSGDKKSQAIALLVKEYVLRPCHALFQNLSLAVASPEEETVEGLRQKLWEFCEAYQKLVCWTNHLSNWYLISTSGEAASAVWREKHKLFLKKAEELIAPGGFFQLPENLQGRWHDLEL